MIWKLILIIVASLIVGFIAGMLLYFKIVHKSGTLIVNINEPDRDIYRIDYKDDLDLIAEKKYIVLKISKM